MRCEGLPGPFTNTEDGPSSPATERATRALVFVPCSTAPTRTSRTTRPGCRRLSAALIQAGLRSDQSLGTGSTRTSLLRRRLAGSTSRARFSPPPYSAMSSSTVSWTAPDADAGAGVTPDWPARRIFTGSKPGSPSGADTGWGTPAIR